MLTVSVCTSVFYNHQGTEGEMALLVQPLINCFDKKKEYSAVFQRTTCNQFSLLLGFLYPCLVCEVDLVTKKKLHLIIYQISNEVDISFFEVTKEAPGWGRTNFPCLGYIYNLFNRQKIHMPTS